MGILFFKKRKRIGQLGLGHGIVRFISDVKSDVQKIFAHQFECKKNYSPETKIFLTFLIMKKSLLHVSHDI